MLPQNHKRKSYPSDLTDKQFKLIEDLIKKIAKAKKYAGELF